MTQPDTHDHPGGAAQPTVSELPDNAAELTSAVYIKDLLGTSRAQTGWCSVLLVRDLSESETSVLIRRL
jgi:hypothetical protein